MLRAAGRTTTSAYSLLPDTELRIGGTSERTHASKAMNQLSPDRCGTVAIPGSRVRPLAPAGSAIR